MAYSRCSCTNALYTGKTVSFVRHVCMFLLWSKAFPSFVGVSQYIVKTMLSRAVSRMSVNTRCMPLTDMFLHTCVGIHPGRVEPASPIALTTSRTEAFHARRSCASSLDTFTQSFLHRAWPKTRGPEIGSRSALVVVAHVFSWPPVRLRHVRGGVGRRRSLISSPSGRLAAWPDPVDNLLIETTAMAWIYTLKWPIPQIYNWLFFFKPFILYSRYFFFPEDGP